MTKIKEQMQKLMGGCGKEIQHRVDNLITLCGNPNTSNFLRLNKEGTKLAYRFEFCSSCSSSIKTSRQLIKDELDFLEENKKYYESSNGLGHKFYGKPFLDRISDLREALKCSEGIGE